MLAALALLIAQLMRDGDVPGVSMVVIRDGRIASEQAFGVANAETAKPLTTDAVFESASLAKPVFAYAVLQLVDRGKFSLDVPLSQYLDEAVTDPRMKSITARMVLTHTTGYQNEVMPGQTLQLQFEPGARSCECERRRDAEAAQRAARWQMLVGLHEGCRSGGVHEGVEGMPPVILGKAKDLNMRGLRIWRCFAVFAGSA